MFEYDPDKSAANLAKHGIDFERAQAIWRDQRRIVAPTYSGGDDERWIAVGMIEDKLWSAAFTWREGNVRLISVRRSRPGEAKEYDSEDEDN